MTAKQLEQLKKLLLKKQEKIIAIIEHKKQDELQKDEGGDEIDTALNNEEKELIFGVSDTEKSILNEIDNALKKIATCKYGFCEACGVKISFERLKARPYSRYCIKCKPKYENHKHKDYK